MLTVASAQHRKLPLQRQTRYLELSAEHHSPSSQAEVMAIWSTAGLGRKSVACILLLCLQGHDFPVDTNVGRICARLGWLPFDQEKPLEVHCHAGILDASAFAADPDPNLDLIADHIENIGRHPRRAAASSLNHAHGSCLPGA
jgi:hypothetical protein